MIFHFWFGIRKGEAAGRESKGEFPVPAPAAAPLRRTWAEWLAVGAEVGAAAADDDAFDGGAAVVAGLAGALEYGNGVLHVAFFAVGFAVTIYAGPFALNAETKHLLDGGVEGR
jgi:hypothetical protein